MCGCLFVLLFWWLNEQWRTHVVFLEQMWTPHFRFHFQSIRLIQSTFIKPCHKSKPLQDKSHSLGGCTKIGFRLLISFTSELHCGERKCDIFIRFFQNSFSWREERVMWSCPQAAHTSYHEMSRIRVLSGFTWQYQQHSGSIWHEFWSLDFRSIFCLLLGCLSATSYFSIEIE